MPALQSDKLKLLRQRMPDRSTPRFAALFSDIHAGVPRPYHRAVLTLNYCYAACLGIHVGLIGLFIWMGEALLAAFNVGSVLLFALCLYYNAVRGAYRLPVYFATAEIMATSSICVITFGWDAGFHYYALALGVSTFIIPWWSVGRKLGLVALVGLLSVGLSVYARGADPLRVLDPAIVYACYITNLLILFASLGLIGFAVTRSAARAEESLEREKRRSEELLHNILPEEIAERLRKSASIIADRFEGTTILFCDLVGFTSLSEAAAPEDVVSLLNRIFTEFDTLADRHGLEKIKTIGDAYMVAGGLPVPRPDHAVHVAGFALEMQSELARIANDSGLALTARIGIHSGPAVAGVIGFRKFAYDVWGDTVNTASRMESHGLPGEIHVSETTWALIREHFACDERGIVAIKGKGPMRTFWLRGRLALASVRPDSMT